MRAAEKSAPHHADLDLLARAVREAGDLAFGKFRATFKSWTKQGDSPVSEVDIAANDLLHARLTPARPDYAWLSEESVDDRTRLDAARVWIIDPIDGTRAFIAGREDWCVSAALTENGRPIVAAIYAPAENTMLLAQAGGGVFLNGEPLRNPSDGDVDTMRVAGPPRFLEAVVKAKRHVEAVSKVHSLALRLARVATGDLHVAFAGRNSHDWDIAAADLIVHESGGLLTDFEGKRPQYNRATPSHPALIAATPSRHAKMLDFFKSTSFQS